MSFSFGLWVEFEFHFLFQFWFEFKIMFESVLVLVWVTAKISVSVSILMCFRGFKGLGWWNYDLETINGIIHYSDDNLRKFYGWGLILIELWQANTFKNHNIAGPRGKKFKLSLIDKFDINFIHFIDRFYTFSILSIDFIQWNRPVLKRW